MCRDDSQGVAGFEPLCGSVLTEWLRTRVQDIPHGSILDPL